MRQREMAVVFAAMGKKLANPPVKHEKAQGGNCAPRANPRGRALPAGLALPRPAGALPLPAQLFGTLEEAFALVDATG